MEQGGTGMTTEADILGRPPIRKARRDEGPDLSGPTFAELCRPLSAKVMPKRLAVFYDDVTATRVQRHVQALTARNKRGR